MIANHCYDLVKAFSSFYQDHPIAKEEDINLRQLRLGLCATISATVTNGMNMLGIDMPERM